MKLFFAPRVFFRSDWNWLLQFLVAAVLIFEWIENFTGWKKKAVSYRMIIK